MPPSPALASSLVAQDSPAPPRSWMPTTSPPPKSSRQHSMRTFSANGSPTWTLGSFLRPGRWVRPVEGLRGEHRDPADPVEARARPEEHDLVAGAGGERQVQVLVAQHADAQRVDQRVARVARVEDDLATDVGQAQAVAVEADAGDDTGQHPGGVGGVERADAQPVHDGDRARAHGHDVAHDAADAGGRALVRLDVRRVVVRLDLEGDGPAVADVDDARVLADARPAGARASPRWSSRRSGAGGPSRTCRSSARTTSPSTWRARPRSAGDRGSPGCGRTPRRAGRGRRAAGARRVSPRRARRRRRAAAPEAPRGRGSQGPDRRNGHPSSVGARRDRLPGPVGRASPRAPPALTNGERGDYPRRAVDKRRSADVTDSTRRCPPHAHRAHRH